MLNENDKIRVHMIDWPHRCEIKTRNYGQVFTVTKRPGISPSTGSAAPTMLRIPTSFPSPALRGRLYSRTSTAGSSTTTTLHLQEAWSNSHLNTMTFAALALLESPEKRL